MDEWQKDLVKRAEEYTQTRRISIVGQLGNGYDGTVVATSRLLREEWGEKQVIMTGQTTL